MVFNIFLTIQFNNYGSQAPERQDSNVLMLPSIIYYQQVRVDYIINQHAGLKEFASQNPWFSSLVSGMLSNWLKEPEIITSTLDNLSNREALSIGKSLSSALEDRVVAESGVDLWIQQYPALVELSKRNKFFVSMATTIGRRNLEQAPWGLVVKVGLGAVLSMLNIATDVFTILNFMRLDKRGFANASIGMIVLSVGLQSFVVYFQRKKRGVRVVLREMLVVLFFLKPAIGALRVLTGEKPHDGDTVDFALELVLSKVAEM